MCREEGKDGREGEEAALWGIHDGFGVELERKRWDYRMMLDESRYGGCGHVVVSTIRNRLSYPHLALPRQ